MWESDAIASVELVGNDFEWDVGMGGADGLGKGRGLDLYRERRRGRWCNFHEGPCRHTDEIDPLFSV